MKTEETKGIESVLYYDLFGANPSLAKEYGTTEVTIGFQKDRKNDRKKKELVDFLSYDARKNIFRCYEIKVSMQDFRSNAAMSWYGNYNYLVLAKGLYQKQSLREWKKQIPDHVGIIVIDPDTKCNLQSVVKRPKYIEISEEQKDMLKRSLIRTLFYQNRKRHHVDSKK